MRIAQVAPLYESVPPRLYGGTERVVHYLTEELVAMGHEVTLFASGDSHTSARLIAPVNRALRLTGAKDTASPHILLLESLLSRRSEFDIVHFHTDWSHLPFARHLHIPCLTTMHGRLDAPELAALFGEYREHPLISISDAQRSPLPRANWQATVYHGLPRGLLPFSPRGHHRPYLAFTGRISPEKRPDLAIEIARRVGMPLRIAAKIDNADREYFDAHIRHLFELPWVEYIGEIDERQKAAFLGSAAALLFPIDWPEPFGLVMIEAMSCGTPIVAFRAPHSSVPEVIDHGRSGLIIPPLAEDPALAIDRAAAATMAALRMDRRAVRETFDRRFTSRRMAEDYLNVYRRLAAMPASIPSSNGHAGRHNGAVRAWRHDSASVRGSAGMPEPNGAPPADPALGAEHGRNR